MTHFGAIETMSRQEKETRDLRALYILETKRLLIHGVRKRSQILS